MISRRTRPVGAQDDAPLWMHGAGDDTHDAGLEIVGAAASEAVVAWRRRPSAPRWRATTPVGALPSPPEPGGETWRASASAQCGATRAGACRGGRLARAVLLDRTRVTTRSRCCGARRAIWWLGAIHLRPPCAPAELTVERLCTGREYLHMQCNLESLEQRWELVRQAMSREERGTRLTVVLPRDGDEAWAARPREAGLDELDLPSLGIEHAGGGVEMPWGSDGLERRTLVGGYIYRVFVGGAPRYSSASMTLDHDEAEADMDPRDLGIGCEAPERKAKRSYIYRSIMIRSDGEGRTSPRVCGAQLMTEGHTGSGATSRLASTRSTSIRGATLPLNGWAVSRRGIATYGSVLWSLCRPRTRRRHCSNHALRCTPVRRRWCTSATSGGLARTTRGARTSRPILRPSACRRSLTYDRWSSSTSTSQNGT